MSNRRNVRVSPVYRPHWLAYWQLVAVTIMLTVLGFACLPISVPVALLLLGLATFGAVSICLYRTWHFLYFTEDRRLVYQHGFLGCHTDVVRLVGRINQTQMPLLGKLLNVGDVYVGTMGPDLYLRHIGQFDDFSRFLMASS